MWRNLTVHKLFAYRACLAICLFCHKSICGNGKAGRDTGNQAAFFYYTLNRSTFISLGGWGGRRRNSERKIKTELGEETEGYLQDRWR